ncbi:MAG: hypothetical protein LC123_02375 [Burkholderiales bacterium]|nr:hypothetical protein [Burkholderiales bacterium]
MLQDLVVLCIGYTGNPDYIERMSIPELVSFAESVTRLRYRDKVEDVQAARAAQHADKKEFKKFLDGWLDLAVAKDQPPPPAERKSTGGLEDFLVRRR